MAQFSKLKLTALTTRIEFVSAFIQDRKILDPKNDNRAIQNHLDRLQAMDDAGWEAYKTEKLSAEYQKKTAALVAATLAFPTAKLIRKKMAA